MVSSKRHNFLDFAGLRIGVWMPSILSDLAGCHHPILPQLLLLLQRLDSRMALEDHYLLLQQSSHVLYVPSLNLEWSFLYFKSTCRYMNPSNFYGIKHNNHTSYEGICWQVMYDSSGVRLHAGRQAEVCLCVLWMLVFCLFDYH